MVSKVYDRVANRYDNDWSGIYATSRAHCIRQIVRYFESDRHSIDAVDFAIGTGNAFYDLRQHFQLGNCTGFDISGGMLSLAAGKLSQDVHLIQQDAIHAAEYVPHESMDLAMSHFLLNFVELDQLLGTSLKLLRPGGVLSLVTSTQQSLAELHTERFPKTARLLGAKRSLKQMSTPETHQQCLEKLQEKGFEIVEQKLWRQPVSFESFDDIRSWAVDSGWMVSSLDRKLGLRIALGRVMVGLLERSMHPFYPLEGSTEISIVLARKPVLRGVIQAAA